MIGTRLSLIGTQVTLYTDVDELDGSGGASIAAWEDAGGYRPRDSMLRWTNNGADPLQIGDGTTPAQLLVDGALAAVLFEGHQVTITPGQTIWCPVPANMPALGDTWSLLSPLASASPIELTVTARKIDTSAPTAAEVAALIPASPTAAAIADAVLAEVLADHAGVAGSLAQTLLIVKGLTNGNVVHDLHVYNATTGMLESVRIRVFPTGADAIAGTNVLATFNMVAVNGDNGPTSYRVAQA